MSKILVLSQNPEIAKILEKYLVSNNFIVQVSHQLQEARNFVKEIYFNLIIIDLPTKGQTYLDFCHSFREEGVKIPILFLSDLPVEGQVNDCDPKLSEFIIKPFKAEEFKKKINYLLGLQFQDKVLVLGDLKIDLLKQIVTIKEKIIALGKKERDILVMLARKTGQVVSHEKLLMVIGESSKNQAQLLNDHINEIRRKFKETSTNHLKISSFYGGGYRLDLRS